MWVLSHPLNIEENHALTNFVSRDWSVKQMLIYLHIQKTQGCLPVFRIWIVSEFYGSAYPDPDWEEGSGSRQAKLCRKKANKEEISRLNL
jgi:hypothetical protein